MVKSLENSSDAKRCPIIGIGYDNTGSGSGCMYDLSASDIECHVTGIAYKVTGLRIRQSVYCCTDTPKF